MVSTINCRLSADQVKLICRLLALPTWHRTRQFLADGVMDFLAAPRISAIKKKGEHCKICKGTFLNPLPSISRIRFFKKNLVLYLNVPNFFYKCTLLLLVVEKLWDSTLSLCNSRFLNLWMPPQATLPYRSTELVCANHEDESLNACILLSSQILSSLGWAKLNLFTSAKS